MPVSKQSLQSLDDFRSAVFEKQLERPIIEQCDVFNEIFVGSTGKEMSRENVTHLLSKSLEMFNGYQNSISKLDDDPLFDGLNILYLFVDMLSISETNFGDDPVLSTYVAKLPSINAAIERLREKHSKLIEFATLASAATTNTEKMAELQERISSATKNAAADINGGAVSRASFREWVAGIAFLLGLVVGLIQLFDNAENWWVPILLGVIVAGALFWRGSTVVVTSIDT
jgi:hypothetical protein